MFDDSTIFPSVALGADGGSRLSEEGNDGESFWILETARNYPC